MRALIIEDDQNAAGLLAKVLREERFAVDITQSGEEGDEMTSVTNYECHRIGAAFEQVKPRVTVSDALEKSRLGA